MSPSIWYYEPLQPEQRRRERLVYLIVFCVAALAITLLFVTDRGEPAMGEHPAEPSCEGGGILVEVVEDAATIDHGQMRCVQPDTLNPTKE